MYGGFAADADGLETAVERQAERRCLHLLEPVNDDMGTGTNAVTEECRLLPCLTEWIPLIEAGEERALRVRVDRLFAGAADGSTDETLEEIYYGIRYLIYYTIHKNRRKVGGILENVRPREDIETADELKKWALSALTACMEAVRLSGDGRCGIICQVKSYIAAHLLEGCTREEIARSVYLNPAYLSRLFKRETGISLTDYVIQLRIALSKRMLANDGVTGSAVAERGNCYNFSYFSRMFKKYVGVTPTEYRHRRRMPASGMKGPRVV